MTLFRWTVLTLLPALLSGCGGGNMSTPSVVVRPLAIVVVGDSISKLEVLPSSTLPCSIHGSLPCNYSTDGSKAYPALVAEQTGDRVDNLAQSGSLSIGDQTIEGVLVPGVTTVIPRIPRNTNVVICESGLNDISYFGRGAPSRVPIVAAALKARVDIHRYQTSLERRSRPRLARRSTSVYCLRFKT